MPGSWRQLRQQVQVQQVQQVQQQQVQVQQQQQPPAAHPVLLTASTLLRARSDSCGRLPPNT
jgi:hypothetical protein